MRTTILRLLIGVTILLVALAWRAGDFDSALVHVHLNAKPCIHTYYGSTLCGEDATGYCDSVAAGGAGIAACEHLGTVNTKAVIEGAESQLTELEAEQRHEDEVQTSREAEEAARAAG